MTSQKVSEEKQTITLQVSVGPEDFKRSLQAAHRRNARYFQVPGFRKGKAPYPIVVNYYGESVLYDDALEDAVPKAYEAALKEQDIDARSTPRFDVKTISGKEGLVFEAQVAVAPDVRLGAYEGVEAFRPAAVVEESEIDERVEAARQRVARLVPVTDRPIAKGDEVTLDYEGFRDGKPFDGGKDSGHKLEIGSNSFIPGFEDGLIGHSSGDAFDLPLTFPEKYHSRDLAGKDVIFHVLIHDVHVKEFPAVDDEFVRDVSDKADNVEEYREELRGELLKQKERQADGVFEEHILDEIVKHSDISFSDLMIEDDIDETINSQQRQFAMYGMKFEDFLKYSGQTMQDFRVRQRDVSRVRLERACVLEAIRREREEQFLVRDEALEEEISKAADEAGVTVDVYKKEYLRDEHARDHFRSNLEMKNLLDWLRGVSTATDVDPHAHDHEHDHDHDHDHGHEDAAAEDSDSGKENGAEA